MKKKLIFTGGGSGGHVVSALTLIEELKNNYNVFYIGSYKGVERSLVTAKSLPYYAIQTGKLRRYFSLENFIDLFRLAIGFLQAFWVILCLGKVHCVFSMGGFVSVPVVVAAWILRKKIYIHEQTTRAGLANKIASRFASKVFISFEGSFNEYPRSKTILSGYPVRKSCFSSPEKEIKVGGEVIALDRPLLLITGGGNGSKLLNEYLLDSLHDLKKKYRIIHQVGKLFIDEYAKHKDENYIPIDLLGDEIIELFKISEVVLSRSGAGTVAELIAIGRRSLFVPLKIAQKDEQYHNALEAEKLLGSIVIKEDDLRSLSLSERLESFEGKRVSKQQSESPVEVIRSHIDF